MLRGGIKFFFGFLRFYSSGATLLALLDRLDPSGIDVAERLGGGDTPAQFLGHHVAPLGHVGDLVATARAEHDPDNQLGAAAMTLAGLAAAEEATGFPGGDLPADTNMEAAGPFEDVSGVHQAGVDALDTLGLFDGTGCGDARFCPDLPIHRWVMAVWLVRALDGSDPSAAATGRFTDVSPGEWWAPHVERLAEMDVTHGCGDGSEFCPTDAVTRGQMATFLVRALGLDAAGSGPEFTDIADHPHRGSISILAAERVTSGCSVSPLRFCPNRPVTRGQMATFMARALNLIPRPQPVSPSVQRMAYEVGTGDGNLQLWVADADGTNPTNSSIPVSLNVIVNIALVPSTAAAVAETELVLVATSGVDGASSSPTFTSPP